MGAPRQSGRHIPREKLSDDGAQLQPEGANAELAWRSLYRYLRMNSDSSRNVARSSLMHESASRAAATRGAILASAW